MYTGAPQQMQEAPVQAAPEPQAKPKGPTKSKGDTGVGSFIRQLIELSAYVHQLQVQSHLMHFNYEAANFTGIHAFLKDQYEAHIEQFDKLGEFIRSMDYLMPMCHEGLMDASPEFKHVKSYKPTEMLTVYYKNLEELGMKTKKLEPIAAKIKAIDIQNYMAELCGQAFKAAWFIKATLRNT
jgi:DNA-binding ferritin-like protein